MDHYVKNTTPEDPNATYLQSIELKEILGKVNLNGESNTPALRVNTSTEGTSAASIITTFGSHACPGVDTPRKESSGDLSPESSAQFAHGVRAKLAEVLPALIYAIPVNPNDSIHIAEFGCLNSRSVFLCQVAIELFLRRVYPQRHAGNAALTCLADMESSGVNFVTIHEDSLNADFRTFVRMLNTAPESHLNPLWQSSRSPSLHNSVFPLYAARPFGSRIVPPSTLHLGFSLMDLHWTHTPNTMDVSLATTAHAELHLFLTARANEFRKGGVFIVAFISRSSPEESERRRSDATVTDHATREARETSQRESGDTHSGTSRSGYLSEGGNDIWSTLTDMLVPCLLRLVSCGMLKSSVARHMLTLPLHPRTPTQTRRVLKQLSHLWSVEWSCGLGLSDNDGDALRSIPEPLRLPHPACAAFQAGVLNPQSLTEQILHLLKNLYESHFRLILRERGKLSNGAVEFILDSLWDVAYSRILDQCILDKNVSPFSNLEIGVQLFALRRL